VRRVNPVTRTFNDYWRELYWLEFGQMFRRFGSKVTIIERGDRLISKEDDNVSDTVADIMQSEAIELIFRLRK
jgi:pyruvate/2-oxoglutarate dehydrogenase complex dihydrolipoamide dehydrogenase (E3) component